jgi:hypothetical protein
MAQKANAKDLVLTSFHQAGHAVACLHFGLVINAVSIAKDGSGACEREAPSGDAYIELVCSLAGPLAEAAVAGKVGCLNYGEAARVLSATELAQAHRYAQSLVLHQWASIARLANVLLSARYLPGSAIAQIVYDNVAGRPAQVC